MGLRELLGLAKPTGHQVPEFVREVQDFPGVRVVRLRGAVGKEAGQQVRLFDKEAGESKDVFTRSLLIDFAGTTGWDFATISYLVQAMRRRMAAGARVGIINPSPQLTAEVEMAKLEGLFHIFASEEEAMAELGGESGKWKMESGNEGGGKSTR